MKTIYTKIFLLFTISIFAQPKIELETTKFDFGQIVTAGTIKKDFTIKNIGNEPLVIRRVTTGDGGSYANYPKAPILPDSTGVITFYYNSKRIGPFRKRITIQSNAENRYQNGINIRGEVIYKITQIEIKNDTIDIGEIPFGTIAKATFAIKNIGREKLYLNIVSGKYYELDLFYHNIRPQTPNKERHNIDGNPYEPNEVAMATISLRNVYGNVGDFQRKILLKYNSFDTISVIIKGKYIGKPTQQTIYEERAIYEYENGQLKTKTEITYGGEVRRTAYFKGANCTHSEYYSWQNGKVNVERFFKLGELIEEKRYD